MDQDDKNPALSGSPTMPPWPETMAGDRLIEMHGSPNQLFDMRDVSSVIRLRLTKSQSLLDLVQRMLEDQANAAANVTNAGNSATREKGKAVLADESTTTDKLKASNFPAKRLTIGDWSFSSIYEGDLVAKIYFAKRKLVWEVLDSGGLKNKMEIKWSDICAIKATCPEDQLGTLSVVLARRPLFFRETDPQPRKHTIWQNTTDFTGGYASTNSKHFLECPSGLLSKNFKKLIQCNRQLNMLSQEPATMFDSSAELQTINFEDQVGTQICSAPNILNNYYAHTSILADPQFGSTSSMLPTANGLGEAPGFVPQEITLPPSGPPLFFATNTQTVDGNAFGEMQYSSNPNFSNQYNVHWFQGSVQPDSFANQNNHFISEHMASCDPSSNNEMSDFVTRCLLDDTEYVQTAFDETFFTTMVDHLRHLIQDPASTPEIANIDGTSRAINLYGKNEAPNPSSEAGDDGPPTAIPKEEESYGELLTQIPRVASMPQIFRTTSEDSYNSGDMTSGKPFRNLSWNS